VVEYARQARGALFRVRLPAWRASNGSSER